MKIQENLPLKPFTSMYVGGPARYFVETKSVSDVLDALRFAKEKDIQHFILGGGSNVIISDAGFPGLVIKVCILGRTIIKETNECVEIEVGAGENWDTFVKFAVNQNLYGVENLSHVPGNVGASVVQNIGCYGQEVSESVVSVKVVNKATLEELTFSNEDLLFSYRKSRFNNPEIDKGKYVITHVTFRLFKEGQLNMKYDDIKKYFTKHSDINPSLETIRAAVIAIRDSKFPFPDAPTNGTAGSFWNVDVVDETTYENIVTKLKEKGFGTKAEEMTNKKSVFQVRQGYKLVPGLFVEVLGLRGKSVGGAKILDKHGGIINNYTGKATAKDVLDLSKEVVDMVQNEFGVQMKIEPEIVS